MIYNVIGNQQSENTSVTMATIFVTARRFFDHLTTLDFYFQKKRTNIELIEK